ncbi:hypothetical protein FS763_04405 [Agrobacterium vitis]|uniref:Lar family restriction alleviation protein n=1 Tax=Allorhizobium ampelinum TaxID=3025782 RepID=UPI001F3EC05C|nr:Lar family restriction alleviation protein [Allorhizobium ampelinum]MCF1471168.1 hypothetical protein [Allorhizobium ampelinum]
MTETLLHCPFCGDKAQIEKWHGGQPDRHMVSCWNTDCDHDPRVIAETRAEAVQKWNRRAMIVLECGGEAPPVYVQPVAADVTGLDWSNFEGPKRNTEWKPGDQDLIYTAINFRDDEWGDADEDAAQQIVERLLAAWQRSERALMVKIGKGQP